MLIASVLVAEELMDIKNSDSQNPDTIIDLQVAKSESVSPGDCPHIWLDPEVEKQIEQFANTDTSKELGGVLLGELVTDGGTPQVRILAAIEAKHTKAVHTSIKFTHATWEDINKLKDERYPHLRIVGWFHTHPGFGIFLSRWDMFIHENFFNLPWQVAYVVDPVNGRRGFFRWENGKIQPVGESTSQQRPVLIVEDQQPRSEFTTQRQSRLPAIAAVVAIVSLGVVSLYLAFFRPPQVKEVTKVIERVAPVGTSRPIANVAASKCCKNYYVQPGDCLWNIAAKEYGDGSYIGAICLINGIKNPNSLYAGTKLVLPCKEIADKLCRIASR